MRVSLGCMFGCTLLVLSALGVAFGQDTNFASGPQYLINPDPTNHASPLFARAISTPSLSLAGPPLEVGASDATGVLTPGAGDQNVVPPSPDALPKVDFSPIYYGSLPVSVVEISFPANSETSQNELPASILDTGVWQITTVQALRERGFGVTLPEAAANSRAHARHGTRVFTNADIDRLRSGS
jgi:hypothetical protein